MILQNVIIKCVENENAMLYIRQTGSIAKESDGLIFRKGAVLSTNTYFNTFSINKWKRYCDLNTVFLNLSVKGNFLLQIFNSCHDGAERIDHIIFEKKLYASEEMEQVLAVPECQKGVVYFTLKALSEGARLKSAGYTTQEEPSRKVKLALNICTYKREKYLFKNLSVLKQNVLHNPDSVLYGQMEVFITDNGNTIDLPSIIEPGIHAVHNLNLGGTGGFARGLMAIIRQKEIMGITHVIFMDDDVEIEPESLVRTFSMLIFMKQEYYNAFIAGAMLRLDTKYIQHENGALWGEGKCRFLGRGLDLRNFSNVVLNEEEIHKDYAAWWYCCVPAEIVREDNLPVPLFIHEDDVEYSLRNTKHIITLNGIAIWHEANEHRRVSSNEYYNLRNMLIVNALHCPGYSLRKVRRQVLTALLIAMLRYRYRDMYLIEQAVEDFCKGPKWLLKIDAAQYHQDIQRRGYSFQEVDGLLENALMKASSQRNSQQGFKYQLSHTGSVKEICKLLIQLLSLNGYFLPPDNRLQAYYMNVHPVSLYRAGRLLLFDDADRKGIVTERSVKQLPVMLKIYGRLLVLLQKKYKKSCKKYRACFKELKSINYWKRALKV